MISRTGRSIQGNWKNSRQHQQAYPQWRDPRPAEWHKRATRAGGPTATSFKFCPPPINLVRSHTKTKNAPRFPQFEFSRLYLVNLYCTRVLHNIAPGLPSSAAETVRGEDKNVLSAPPSRLDSIVELVAWARRERDSHEHSKILCTTFHSQTGFAEAAFPTVRCQDNPAYCNSTLLGIISRVEATTFSILRKDKDAPLDYLHILYISYLDLYRRIGGGVPLASRPRKLRT